MKAKKIIETVTEEVEEGKEGKNEIQKTHVMDVDISEELVARVCEYWEDDAQNAYEYGIVYDNDEELIYIEVDNFIEAIEGKIEDMKDEGEDEDEELSEILKKLQKYKGYTIWM